MLLLQTQILLQSKCVVVVIALKVHIHCEHLSCVNVLVVLKKGIVVGGRFGRVCCFAFQRDSLFSGCSDMIEVLLLFPAVTKPSDTRKNKNKSVSTAQQVMKKRTMGESKRWYRDHKGSTVGDDRNRNSMEFSLRNNRSDGKVVDVQNVGTLPSGSGQGVVEDGY